MSLMAALEPSRDPHRSLARGWYTVQVHGGKVTRVTDNHGQLSIFCVAPDRVRGGPGRYCAVECRDGTGIRSRVAREDDWAAECRLRFHSEPLAVITVATLGIWVSTSSRARDSCPIGLRGEGSGHPWSAPPASTSTRTGARQTGQLMLTLVETPVELTRMPLMMIPTSGCARWPRCGNWPNGWKSCRWRVPVGWVGPGNRSPSGSG